MAVEVKYFGESQSRLGLRVSDVISKLRHYIEDRKITKAMFVLVAANGDILARLIDHIDNLDVANITFTFGLLNEVGEFEALRTMSYEL
jgi:hypothetical protein